MERINACRSLKFRSTGLLLFFCCVVLICDLNIFEKKCCFRHWSNIYCKISLQIFYNVNRLSSSWLTRFFPQIVFFFGVKLTVWFHAYCANRKKWKEKSERRKKNNKPKTRVSFGWWFFRFGEFFFIPLHQNWKVKMKRFARKLTHMVSVCGLCWCYCLLSGSGRAERRVGSELGHKLLLVGPLHHTPANQLRSDWVRWLLSVLFFRSVVSFFNCTSLRELEKIWGMWLFGFDWNPIEQTPVRSKIWVVP